MGKYIHCMVVIVFVLAGIVNDSQCLRFLVPRRRSRFDSHCRIPIATTKEMYQIFLTGQMLLRTRLKLPTRFWFSFSNTKHTLPDAENLTNQKRILKNVIRSWGIFLPDEERNEPYLWMEHPWHLIGGN